jgi:hypothetical protein
MNPLNANHLSDDQIDDYLMGDLASDAVAHLDLCDLCLCRVAQMQAPIASFKAVSLAWSERRSATMPTQPAAQPSRWSNRLAWGSAATAALVIGLIVPAIHHDGRPSDEAKVQPPVMMASSGAISSLTREQQINQDNQMLMEIDQALDSGTETPAALGMQTTDIPARSHGRGTARD